MFLITRIWNFVSNLINNKQIMLCIKRGSWIRGWPLIIIYVPMNNANKIYIDIAPGLSSQVTVRSPQSYWSWFATMHQPLISVNVYNEMRGSWRSVCNTYILCIYGKALWSYRFKTLINLTIIFYNLYIIPIRDTQGKTLLEIRRAGSLLFS